MNKSKFIFAISLFFVCLLSFSNSFAQAGTEPKAEPNYEVVLQTLLASNDSARVNKTPANLSETVKKLKANYSFANYQLISTHFQRVGNRGNIAYKSLFDELNQKTEDTVVSSWSLKNLMGLSDSDGRKSVGFQSFRFDARIPVKTGTREKEGNSVPVINYESIGLTLERFNVPENIPTLIGTLAMPKADGLIFFVLTVRSVE